MVRTAPDEAARVVTVAEVVALGPALVVAVVATVSLALAHAHHHSLLGVALGSVLVTAGLGYVLFRLGGRPTVVGDRAGTAAVLACGALAAVMFLPGFSYGVSDKDPGGYVAHSVAIARTGSYSFTDPALVHPTLPVVTEGPGARFPGIWIRNSETGLIVPQFFHLWPALLATAYDIGGFGGITATAPVAGIVAVMLLVALLRRVAGLVPAVLGGLLMATNMLQVWQAKFPTAEVLAELLFLATLLCAVLAIRTRWGPAAFVAGLLVDVSFLNRADAWLLVMLAAGALATLYVLRLADAQIAWGAAGLVLLLPYPLWQAYSAALLYTKGNQVPLLKPTLALLASLAVAAVTCRLLFGPLVGPVVAALRRTRWQRLVGFGVCAVALALLLVGFLRPHFGTDYFDYNGRRVRSFDELTMHRLAWFLTRLGFALAGVGVAVAALRRWRADVWAVVLPTLVIFPVFAYHAHNSTRLMWWARRYVSYILPGVVVLIALALGCAFAWRFRNRYLLRVPALAAAAALLWVFLGQSLPLRHHDEWHGSFGVSGRIAALSGPARGVYLWERQPYCCAAPTSLWATPVWLERGELSVLLPSDPAQFPAYVRAYREAYPSDPVFVVWTGPAPDSLAPLGLRPVDHIAGALPMWEESDVHRPSHPRSIPYDVYVYRVP